MAKAVNLSKELSIPAVGLGTWQAAPGVVAAAVRTAIEKGYRFIDCAYGYGNEAEIGASIETAIADKAVSREELFVLSKLWNTKHRPEDVEIALRESLNNLKLDYLDTYLIHWPHSFKPGDELFPKDAEGNLIYGDVHYLETWKAMEKCVEKGLTKSIGLSNFNSGQIQDVLDHCAIKPLVLEVEVHPYFSQEKLVKFCQARNITVIAYSPFGSPDRPWAKVDKLPSPLDDLQIKAIAEKYKKSTAQIILRWLIQRGIVVIPKSVNATRIEENMQVFDFELSSSDMDAIVSLNTNERIIVPRVIRNGKREYRDKDAPYFPFNEEDCLAV